MTTRSFGQATLGTAYETLPLAYILKSSKFFPSGSVTRLQPEVQGTISFPLRDGS
ncbi:unnamed protein product [Penicillium camemberti]|uniref:Str. FM013 n=1 Tax=Penicillium camemberti (strain FM 013) TaxID=1429867 RepID=A0A0G4PKW8_PENC3|nr:unnamed protein product [Penicillium camemberti]